MWSVANFLLLAGFCSTNFRILAGTALELINKPGKNHRYRIVFCQYAFSIRYRSEIAASDFTLCTPCSSRPPSSVFWITDTSGNQACRVRGMLPIITHFKGVPGFLIATKRLLPFMNINQQPAGDRKQALQLSSLLHGKLRQKQTTFPATLHARWALQITGTTVSQIHQ